MSDWIESRCVGNKYSLIAADPAWRFEVYERDTGLDRAPDAHYQTITIADLCAIPVKDWATKNALLAMWVYEPMLPAALQLGEAWGFSFVTVLFRWFKTTNDQLRLFDPTPKQNFGMGYHTRGGACEEMWLFKCGKGLPVLRHDIRKEFFSPVREHSRKPDEVYGWLNSLYGGDQPKLEMFARTKRPGWDVHGLETDKFTATQSASAHP